MKGFRYYKKRPGGVRKTRRGDLEKRVTFRLSPQHLDELEAYGEKEGLSNSVLVRHLVIRFLENQKKTVEVVLPRLGGF
jgi:hypothetical protein